MTPPDIRSWIGRVEERVDTITPFPVSALAATLDGPAYDIAPGSAIPPLCHWLYFLETPPTAATNYDGHGQLGDFMPPVDLPRRMWAGSALTFDRPLRIGDTLTRRSTIRDVAPKTGRSGEMVFVTVEHEIFRDDERCLTDSHTIVYRAAAAPGETPLPPKMAPDHAAHSRTISPSPLLLFRYSALTFNGHRIHYDAPFAAGEGYDGLVVHGPLLATLLLDLVGREMPGARVASFSFRAVAPVTGMEPFSVNGTPEGDGMALWVRRRDGALAMSARAVFA